MASTGRSITIDLEWNENLIKHTVAANFVLDF